MGEEDYVSKQEILREGQILIGPLFSEPMRVETVRPKGPDTWVAGLVGTQSERFRKVTLTRSDLEGLALRDTRHTHGQTPEVLPPLPKAHPAGIP